MVGPQDKKPVKRLLFPEFGAVVTPYGASFVAEVRGFPHVSVMGNSIERALEKLHLRLQEKLEELLDFDGGG